MHIPVLLHEVLEYLDISSGDFIIDGTVNGGGHFAHIVQRVGPRGRALGVDLDNHILTSTAAAFAADARAVFAHGSYANLPTVLAQKHLPKAQGLLLDLGFSSLQLAGSGRGFSFEADEPLAMTYDREALPLSTLLSKLRPSELADIIFQYSGERYSRAIAAAISETARVTPITTSRQLARIVASAVPRDYEHGRIDPATRTFQALRMYANGELESLTNVLARLPEIVERGGRVVIISFHSLEDRLVKQSFAEYSRQGSTILTPHPVEGSLAEIAANPRSRSAKLRALSF